jgi:hypothetical protein
VRTLSNVIKIVSAVTTSLLASLRYIIAVLLAILLFWVLIEMAYGVWHSSYRLLAVLFIIVLVVLIVMVVLQCVELEKPGALAAYSGNLNIIPLAILDLALVLAAIFVSSQFSSPLATPLLRFCQTIFNKLTS